MRKKENLPVGGKIWLNPAFACPCLHRSDEDIRHDLKSRWRRRQVRRAYQITSHSPRSQGSMHALQSAVVRGTSNARSVLHMGSSCRPKAKDCSALNAYMVVGSRQDLIRCNYITASGTLPGVVSHRSLIWESLHSKELEFTFPCLAILSLSSREVSIFQSLRVHSLVLFKPIPMKTSHI